MDRCYKLNVVHVVEDLIPRLGTKKMRMNLTLKHLKNLAYHLDGGMRPFPFYGSSLGQGSIAVIGGAMLFLFSTESWRGPLSAGDGPPFSCTALSLEG